MLSHLLNGIIRFSLRNRLLVAAAAVFVLLFGGWRILHLPIDVFPDLNRPRVVVITEAPGLAPEEVETRITFPLETALNGATGVQAVRSTSGPGLSIINVEFDWGTDILANRQIVNERIALAADHFPPEVSPQLAPISSIMGQIVVVGVFSRPSDATRLFTLPLEGREAFNEEQLDAASARFQEHGEPLSAEAQVSLRTFGEEWHILDAASQRHYTVTAEEAGLAVHRTTSPMALRTLADWVIRQQLLTVPGVAQVVVMGGERRQFQVLVNPELLRKYGITLAEVKEALAKSNENTTGGYLQEQGPNELLVRALGRIRTLGELEEVVVSHRAGRSVLLRQVAQVRIGPQVKRGDGSVHLRDPEGRFHGGPAVVLTINKQPEADTRAVTRAVEARLARLAERLPADVQVEAGMYQQKVFIDLAIHNVSEALRDGGLLVVVILFVFLLNLRVTFITLTAIPLSIVVTGLVFDAFGMSINTMTLGGLAVAIGELVDDAIVDVENIYRRLRENRARPDPKPPILVVFQASVEVRNSIVFGTFIVVIVFIPLFALEGMEGRLFRPLGVAYVVSIVSSLLVSLTVTPVLAYWLLPGSRRRHAERDNLLVRGLKRVAAAVIRLSLAAPLPILAAACGAVLFAGAVLWHFENDFLPPFDEGAVQINVMVPPGNSLQTSNEVAEVVDRRLREIPDIVKLVRRTGRAELDEHAVGVNISEVIATIDPESPRHREEILEDIRHRLADVHGAMVSVEQPLAHLISHMLSGVKAQVAVKLSGPDLHTLRRTAEAMEGAIADLPGVTDLYVEQQQMIPQLRIEIDGARLAQFGLTRGDITEFIHTAMNGEVVSEVLEGERSFALLVRLEDAFREDLESVRRLVVPLPDGGATTLAAVAEIHRGAGPSVIERENVRRRIVLQCNVSDRGLVDVVRDIKLRLRPFEESLPADYSLEYGGQFESQQSASQLLVVLFIASLVGMFLVLYTMFGSANLALQVMVALPMAFLGSVAALALTGQTLTIAAMVGFISLCGIAARNGILLINHYLHLVRVEGEELNGAMIIRAGQERLSPVLMTALTSGIGLVPLALAAEEPGKEILYPVATVIIGGLISSTLLEFLVRPALFQQFGLGAARRALESRREETELTTHEEAASLLASTEDPRGG